MARETRWNEGVAAALVEVAAELPETRVGKMFGYPALYTGGKLYACAYGEGVGLKLPGRAVAGLIEEPSFEAFRPYGKARMREWVLLRATSGEAVRTQFDLLEWAARFVAEGRPEAQPRRARRAERDASDEAPPVVDVVLWRRTSSTRRSTSGRAGERLSSG